MFDSKIESEVQLDINITPELQEEGDIRELIRAIQDLRKKKGFTVNDLVTLNVQTNDLGRKLIEKNLEEIIKTTNLKNIEFNEGEGIEVKIGESLFKLSF